MAGAVCGVTIWPAQAIGHEQDQIAGRVVLGGCRLPTDRMLMPMDSNTIERRIKFSRLGSKFRLDRCLCLVLLYDGIVTSARRMPDCATGPREPIPPEKLQVSKHMFKRILIANRGEIACRIIKTARRMGIETVAVYSEADRDALHVEMADEAIQIGPPAAAESYLVDRQDRRRLPQDRRRGGASRLRLSVRARGLSARAGAGRHRLHRTQSRRRSPRWATRSKSKKAAAKAKVSTVPGHLGVIEDDMQAVKIADEIGYPVMIKASAGGGGKGMRIAHSTRPRSRRDLRARGRKRNPPSATTASSSRNSSSIPRHIEIQVLGDKHGNVIHLGERECSIQRRNQKVIEEAPSPLLDETTRARWASRRSRSPKLSATIAPARSSSSPARTRASISSK